MQSDELSLKPDNLTPEEWEMVLKAVAEGIARHRLSLILVGFGPIGTVQPEDTEALKVVAQKLTSVSVMMIRAGHSPLTITIPEDDSSSEDS